MRTVLLVTVATLVLGARVVVAKPTALAQGVRMITIESDSASATGAGYVIRVVRGDGSSIELDRGKGEIKKVHARINMFLHQPELLDVVVQASWEQGWHGGTRETHYVLDLRHAPDRVTCTFAGSESSGGEYNSSSTTIALEKTKASPLAFDLVRTSDAKSTHVINGTKWEHTTTKVIDHLVIGEPSCTPSSGITGTPPS
jgi:hypothetical protein